MVLGEACVRTCSMGTSFVFGHRMLCESLCDQHALIAFLIARFDVAAGARDFKSFKKFIDEHKSKASA